MPARSCWLSLFASRQNTKSFRNKEVRSFDVHKSRLTKPETVFVLCIGLARRVEINPSQVGRYGTDWRRARVVKNLPNDVDCAAGIDGSTSVAYHLPCIVGRQHLENALQNGNVIGTG